MNPASLALARRPPVLLGAAALALAAGGCQQASCDDPGIVCTWAGTGDPAFTGDGQARTVTALFQPMDLAFSAADGRAYLADWQNHRVRRVNADDRVETVIGNDLIGDGPRDSGDLRPEGAPGWTVELNHPTGISFLPGGQVLLAAWHNHKIRQLDPSSGQVNVLVGAGPGMGPVGDGGPMKMALLNQPKSVAADPAGNIFVTDSRNKRIRRIDAASGVIVTIAGSGMLGFSGDGGRPLDASFAMQEDNENPEPGGGLAYDASEGAIYLADTYNNRIRKIDLALQVVTTVAGNGERGFSGDGGPATAARLSRPRDVEIGPGGLLYLADTDNHRIRAVDRRTGVIRTVAGDGRQGFSGEGEPATRASFYRPWGIALGPDGALYVADTRNNRIRRIPR
jgi:DNA-binding beta-propeller fold protein YncE